MPTKLATKLATKKACGLTQRREVLCGVPPPAGAALVLFEGDVEVPDSAFVLDVDTVIVAIGNELFSRKGAKAAKDFNVASWRLGVLARNLSVVASRW